MSAAAAIKAPDFAEPLQGWRAWRVVGGEGGLRLGSVIKRTLWPIGVPLIAECLREPELFDWLWKRRRACGGAPDEECDCGIYAAGLEQIHPYLSEAIKPTAGAVARVLGRVSLWGTVVECERGLRASHAYPRHLYVPADAALRGRGDLEGLMAGLERYGVPIELLPASCAGAVDAIEQRLLTAAGRPEA